MTCSWKAYWGIDCLTCGFQRSFELLFKGEFLESFVQFPATIPLLITFVLLPLHVIFNFKKGAYFITASFILSAVLIVVNYGVKIYAGEIHIHL